MVGVVIPYYNKTRLLAECLLSLEGQHDLCQVVIVDDGSDAPVVPPIFNTCPVKILRLWEKHHGHPPQRARNYGWWWLRTQHRLCNLIVFSDQDVTWKKRAFLHMHEALEMAHNVDSKVAYVYGDYERVGTVTGTWSAGEFDPKRLVQVNFISTMSMVYTKTLPAPPFVEDEGRLQDWSLWLRMLRNGRIGAYVPKPLFSAFYDDDCISVRDEADYYHWSNLIRSRYV